MTALPASPYKGLNAFEDSDVDALLFFGREREREIVVANLIASRLTVLYGPSGVGKSSLLRAAVARSLRELPEQPVVVVFSRWSDDPARGLAAAVADAAGVPGGAAFMETLEAAQAGRDVYLILDQAEEYFLYHADDEGSGSFADALPRVLASPLRVNVLVSLREDSLAKLDRFTGHVAGLFSNTLRLDRLDRAAAEAAIVRPVERFVELTGEPASLEPALVQRVLDEVGAGQIAPALGGLGAVEEDRTEERIEAPYLQLVMQRLWEEERSAGASELRVETLERLGGAQHIVEEHLESAMDELSSAQKDVASKLFNHLVTPSGTKIAHEVTDLADFGDVPVGEVQSVLDVLTERRILRSLEESGAVRYEIFHDVLAHPILAWRARHRTERAVERQIEERSRRRTRLQRLLALGAVALVLLVGVSVFALVQRANADEKARDAQARQLDAHAIALLPEDPELSLLLARESARMSPSPTAEDALLQAVLASRVRDTYRGDSAVESVTISSSGTRIALVTADGRASVVDVQTGEEDTSFEVGSGGEIALLPGDGSALVRGDADPPSVVSLETGDTTCVLGQEGTTAGDAETAGAYVVLVGNAQGSIWDPSRCVRLKEIPNVGATVVRIVTSPDGRRAAFVSGKEVVVVTVPDGRVAYRLRTPGEITSLAFAADGSKLVTGGRDQVTRIWNGKSGRLLHALEGHGGQVLDVAFSPLGTEVASASTDGTARIWNADDGSLVAPLIGHTDFVRTVSFSPDGSSVVTSSDDGTARRWLLNGRLSTFAGHTARLVDAFFSPDGLLLVTGAEDGTVRIWDAGTAPDLTNSDEAPPGAAQTVAESPTGDATATADGTSIRLEHADGSTADLVGHEKVVTSVAFAPDGERLVSASRDSDLVLWDVESGTALRRLRGHFGVVSDARFSPDGRWIVSAGPRSVGLWSAADGRLIRLLYGPTGPFTRVSFLDDSRTIVASSPTSGVSEYDCRECAGIPELLALADERLARTGRELTPEERELYFGS